MSLYKKLIFHDILTSAVRDQPSLWFKIDTTRLSCMGGAAWFVKPHFYVKMKRYPDEAEMYIDRSLMDLLPKCDEGLLATWTDELSSHMGLGYKGVTHASANWHEGTVIVDLIADDNSDDDNMYLSQNGGCIKKAFELTGRNNPRCFAQISLAERLDAIKKGYEKGFVYVHYKGLNHADNHISFEYFDGSLCVPFELFLQTLRFHNFYKMLDEDFYSLEIIKNNNPPLPPCTIHERLHILNKFFYKKSKQAQKLKRWLEESIYSYHGLPIDGKHVAISSEERRRWTDHQRWILGSPIQSHPMIKGESTKLTNIKYKGHLLQTTSVPQIPKGMFDISRAVESQPWPIDQLKLLADQFKKDMDRLQEGYNRAGVPEGWVHRDVYVKEMVGSKVSKILNVPKLYKTCYANDQMKQKETLRNQITQWNNEPDTIKDKTKKQKDGKPMLQIRQTMPGDYGFDRTYKGVPRHTQVLLENGEIKDIRLRMEVDTEYESDSDNEWTEKQRNVGFWHCETRRWRDQMVVHRFKYKLPEIYEEAKEVFSHREIYWQPSHTEEHKERHRLAVKKLTESFTKKAREIQENWIKHKDTGLGKEYLCRHKLKEIINQPVAVTFIGRRIKLAPRYHPDINIGGTNPRSTSNKPVQRKSPGRIFKGLIKTDIVSKKIPLIDYIHEKINRHWGHQTDMPNKRSFTKEAISDTIEKGYFTKHICNQPKKRRSVLWHMICVLFGYEDTPEIIEGKKNSMIYMRYFAPRRFTAYHEKHTIPDDVDEYIDPEEMEEYMLELGDVDSD